MVHSLDNAENAKRNFFFDHPISRDSIEFGSFKIQRIFFLKIEKKCRRKKTKYCIAQRKPGCPQGFFGGKTPSSPHAYTFLFRSPHVLLLHFFFFLFFVFFFATSSFTFILFSYLLTLFKSQKLSPDRVLQG